MPRFSPVSLLRLSSALRLASTLPRASTRAFGVFLVVTLAWGCGASRSPAWDPVTGRQVSAATLAERDALMASGDALFIDRGDFRALSASISAYQEAADLDPQNPEVWVKLARAHYFLADAHIQFEFGAETDDTSARMIHAFEAGTRAAERALVATSPEFRERVGAGTPIERAMYVLDEAAVPALYWRSANLSRWALLRGYITVVAYSDEVRAVMNRCVDLDGSYFYHGPNRYLGAYYAKLSPSAGGNLELSRQYFERARAGSPAHLGTETLFAEYYLVAQGNRAEFIRVLQEVLNRDPSASVDIAPENRVEQQRARALLRNVDALFEE